MPSMEDELGVEGRIEVFEKILLGRTIRSIEFSKNDNGDYTNSLVIKLNDGGYLKILESDVNLLLSPPIDSMKYGTSDNWRMIMPNSSIDMYNEAKKKLKEESIGGVR